MNIESSTLTIINGMLDGSLVSPLLFSILLCHSLAVNA